MTRTQIALGLFLVCFGLADRSQAQEKKLVDPAALDRIAVDTLKEVHNLGADLYNVADAVGAYNTFRAALKTVSPFLAHRPDVQKKIADGLTTADKETTAKARAFRLHELIEAVRADLLKPEEKPKPEVLPKPELPAIPLPPPTPVVLTGTVEGTVTFLGKPISGATVYLVSLNAKNGPRVYNAKTSDAGQYLFSDPLPHGIYSVLVESNIVPQKYRLTQTSPLELVHAQEKTEQSWSLEGDK
jgi:hypothetical protein